MDSAFDEITRTLFAQLRKGVIDNKTNEFDCLICPKCSDRLEPFLLDFEFDPTDQKEYQAIWWTCRGLKEKKCIFPFNIPKRVFWTKRTVEQMREGLLPLPNIHLLPEHLHYLYPKVFKEGNNKTYNKISQATSAATRPSNSNNLINVIENLDNIENEANFSLKFIKSNVQNKKNETIKIKSDQIRYGGIDSRRNVELFADINSALSSNLSLQYSTDTFLSTINSEMSRKQLIKPLPAINQRQRIRLSNYTDKFQLNHQLHLPPSMMIESIKNEVNQFKNEISNKLINDQMYVKNDSEQSAYCTSTIKDNKEQTLDVLKDSETIKTEKVSKSQNSSNLHYDNVLANNSSAVLDTSIKALFYRDKMRRKTKNNSFTYFEHNEVKGIDLALQKFEDSKTTKNLMLRLGLENEIKDSENLFLNKSDLNNCKTIDESTKPRPSTSFIQSTLLPMDEVKKKNLSCVESLSNNPPTLKDNSTISNLTSCLSFTSNESNSNLTLLELKSVSAKNLNTNGSTSNISNQKTTKCLKKTKKKVRKLKTALPIMFGDPEIDNLVLRKYNEVINSIHINRKNKKQKTTTTTTTTSETPTKQQKAGFEQFSSFDNLTDVSSNNKMQNFEYQNLSIINEHGFAIDQTNFGTICDALSNNNLETNQLTSQSLFADTDDQFYKLSAGFFGDNDLAFGLDQF